MEQQNVLTLLPAQVRKGLYIGYGVFGLVGVATVAYYGAVPSLTIPEFVTGGLAVLGALAGPFGVLAASNVKPPVEAGPAPGDGDPVG